MTSPLQSNSGQLDFDLNLEFEFGFDFGYVLAQLDSELTQYYLLGNSF